MANTHIDILLKRGVAMPLPESVFVGEEVNPERISGQGVVIHPGCRITGESTCILAGAIIGEEAPATVQDCQVGPNVRLKGGFFQGAVFLKGSSMGSGAHVRPGTIFEEEANGAHTVGLKQTILFPFVTLGSLINFCDCLMAGGTDRKNHSEVGSSYIHFNYTPQQDKATPSMIGDVCRGVMLNQRPIFLGGQGGLVGPCRIEYGNVIAAGTVWRKDVTKPGNLLMERAAPKSSMPFEPGVYRAVKRVARNNLAYIADLLALRMWYGQVRSRFFHGGLEQALYEGLLKTCDQAIDERIKRFAAFCGKLPESGRILEELAQSPPPESLLEQKRQLAERSDDICACLEQWRSRTKDYNAGDAFLKMTGTSGTSYLECIKGLGPEQAALGTAWLSGFTENILEETLAIVPSCR
ncbi:MAG: protein GlmU [Desulfatibacillum sp.]|nr:protein GlmU [Desulfatibacillum sp.]